MTGFGFPTVRGADLPPLMWAHRGHDDPAIAREMLEPAALSGWFGKPSGGLWTSPVIPHPDGGDKPWTEWTDFLENIDDMNRCRYLTRVIVPDNATFARLATLDDLDTISRLFPTPIPDDLKTMSAIKAIDWVALAATGIDGLVAVDQRVLLHEWMNLSMSDKGEHPIMPMFLSWDCTTVWWCKGSFRFGPVSEIVWPGK